MEKEAAGEHVEIVQAHHSVIKTSIINIRKQTNIKEPVSLMFVFVYNGYKEDLFMRPELHFTSIRNWINDPNGLIYYKGHYHIFYQYYPYECRWGTMHWGHAITNDFMHFTYLPIAMYPTKAYDQDGCFSGSAIEKDGDLYLYYTSIRYSDVDPENITVQKVNDDIVASQSLLISHDGMHFDNLKDKQCLMEPITDPHIGHYNHTRDPKVWKMGEKWYMLLGSKIPGKGKFDGEVLLYESSDAIHFALVSSYSDPAIGSMWECPDLFSVDHQYVLTFSPEHTDEPPRPVSNNQYMFMEFNEKTFKMNATSKNDYLDDGLDLYACQTFLDKDGQRVMLGWLRMSEVIEGEEWIGMYAYPRVLHVKDKHLMQSVHPSIKQAFHQYLEKPSLDKPFSLKGYLEEGDAIVIAGCRIVYEGDCLHMDRSKNNDRGYCVAKTPLLGGHCDIELYYDHHVIEIFVNEGARVISQVLIKLTSELTIDALKEPLIKGL